MLQSTKSSNKRWATLASPRVDRYENKKNSLFNASPRGDVEKHVSHFSKIIHIIILVKSGYPDFIKMQMDNLELYTRPHVERRASALY